ncbi:MAG: 16S rRNA (uracil(1498)-N(3))-methyltransferase [Tidjanibacter sp.]|jgi:16S rRNA (uracil1498-N3)-methyltransferase|nr:16S rRNA (uracil(1498)-N(3))-methyltransferase [Tidjanibacter sp.]
MQLFYAPDITTPLYTLPEEESGHCVRVLRLKEGDSLHITDGRGTLYRAVVEESHPKHCTIRIVEEHPEWEKRPYRLTVAVAPTKNIDRIEWFVEKATECGIDRIVPILCDHSERKVVKQERLEKIAASAMKQSLKAYLPQIDPLTPIKEILAEPFEGVKLIAHCEEDMERIFLGDVVSKGDDVLVLIGPEGDFSVAEIEAARKAGFREITLGNARLRTETAALAATMFTAFVNN